MIDLDFIKRGRIIVTSDGVIAKGVSPSYCMGEDRVFRASVANNIGDNIVFDGVFRVKEWRYATDDEIIRFNNLIAKYTAKDLVKTLKENVLLWLKKKGIL